jgi:hypothetical protein
MVKLYSHVASDQVTPILSFPPPLPCLTGAQNMSPHIGFIICLRSACACAVLDFSPILPLLALVGGLVPLASGVETRSTKPVG